jgi:hypothetical protein
MRSCETTCASARAMIDAAWARVRSLEGRKVPSGYPSITGGVNAAIVSIAAACSPEPTSRNVPVSGAGKVNPSTCSSVRATKRAS